MDRKLGRAGLALALVTVWSGVTHATDEGAKTAARDLAKAAKRDLDAGRLEDAELKFQQAYAIAKVPTLAIWAARVLVKRGRLLAGAELYRQATQLTPNDLWIGNAQQQAQADAKQESAALQPRIPGLRVNVQGAAPNEVDLTIDGVKKEGEWVALDLPADPGRHRIVGKRGAETVELAIDLMEGERKDAFLKFNAGTSVAVPAATASTNAEPASNASMASGPTQVDGATNLTAIPHAPELASHRQPVYRKWWFWTGVGAAVVAGTVTALLLTHQGGDCSGKYACLEVVK
jgi:hypothetical protein